MTISPITQADYRIELISGATLKTVGLLDEAHNFSYALGLFGQGKEGALALHIDSPYAQMLQAAEQYYVRVYRKGVRLRSFMLRKQDYGYETETNRVEDYLELTLAPIGEIFKNVYGLPDPALGLGALFETPNLPLDDAFKWIVSHTCGPDAYDSPAGASRVMAGLTVAAYASAHATTAKIQTAHKRQLWDFLTNYGILWGIDWELCLEETGADDNQLVFRTYVPARGLDKTETNGVRQPVILNDASLNVPSARRHRNYAFPNVVVKANLSDEVEDAASVLAYGRREILSERSNDDEIAAQLKDREQREGWEFDFVESEQCQIVDHFVPGDEVTINNLRLQLPAEDRLVKEIFVNLSSGDEQIELTFGSYEETLEDKGGGDGAVFDPIMGLSTPDGKFVPYSDDFDYETIHLVGDGLDIEGDIPTNTVTFRLTGTVGHDLLSATHPDTVAGSPARGALIVGNSATPSKWQILAHPGVAGYYLRTTDVDIEFNTIQVGDLPAHNLLSATHGDTTAASVQRGDMIVGIGETPKWTRVGLGDEHQAWVAGADEPGWAALDHSWLTNVTADQHHNAFIGLTVGATNVDPNAGDRITLVGGTGIASLDVSVASQLTINSVWQQGVGPGESALYPANGTDALALANDLYIYSDSIGGTQTIGLDSEGGGIKMGEYLAIGSLDTPPVALRITHHVGHPDFELYNGETKGRWYSASGNLWLHANATTKLGGYTYTWPTTGAVTGEYLKATVAGTDVTLSWDTPAGTTDHGALGGLADDDHTQYLLANGSRGLSADWNAGAHNIRAARFEISDANNYLWLNTGQIWIESNSRVVASISGVAQLVVLSGVVRRSTEACDLGSSSFRWTNIYGSTLNIDGATHTIRGVAYTFPSANPGSGAFMYNNGAGTLSWRVIQAGDLPAHTHSTPSYASTASGAQSVTHNHALTYTSTLSGINSAFSDYQVVPYVGGASYYFYVSNSSDGGSPYWTRCKLSNGDHRHAYDKADTPTGNASAGHTHNYDKTTSVS